MNFYERTIEEIKRRIFIILPDNLYLLNENSTSELHNIDDLDFSDLKPSYFQVSCAFQMAKEQYRAAND